MIMRKILFLIAFLLLLSCLAQAQIGLVKKSLKAQYKGKLDKAEKLVNKAIKKDSIMPAVYYAKASLLFDSAYHHFNIDSAYRNLKKGRMFFASLDEKGMRKHIGIGIDLLEFNRLKERIEHAAFIRAEMNNTEEGYIAFLYNYNGSKYQKTAIERRDSLAFETVSQINTYQAYDEFMTRYPQAIQVPDAKRKYERLYFYKSTADGKLISYTKFLEKHPATPYRRDAEKAIFDISTADNTPNSLIQFIKTYPKSQYAHKAKRLLYYIDPLAYEWKSDSLENVKKLNGAGSLILINKYKKYGYVDFSGTVIIPANYADVKAEYLCQTLSSDFFQTNKEVVARNQAIIFSGLFNEAHDLGLGILLIKTPSGGFIIHKSGWPVSVQKVEDAKIIESYISYKINGKWGLMTLAGKIIIKPEFGEIFYTSGYFFLKKGELFDITVKRKLVESADNASLKFQTIYSDFEIMDNGFLWVKSDYGESLLNYNLYEVIPYGRQKIKMIPDGYFVSSSRNNWILKSDLKTQINIGSGPFKINNSYLVYSNQLYYLPEFKSIGKFDSLTLKGNEFAVTYRNDSTFTFFEGLGYIIRQGEVNVDYLNSSSSAQYIGLPKLNGRGWVYYDKTGKIALDGNYEEVKPIGKEYLVVSSGGKKGLFTVGNVQLLAPKFDAIANYNEGYVSYLSKGKFGVVNYTLGVKASNEFDKNIQPYNSFILIGEKDGKKGLTNNTGHPLTEFEFEEINFWSDSVALVKQNFSWHFIDIFENKKVGPKMKSYHFVRNDDLEKVIIGYVENGYGVFSNRKGEVIAPTFNDIINLGSPTEPVYFTEKHVEEAEFYVVIYYDKNGALLYKQAFEGEDYPLIYCEQ